MKLNKFLLIILSLVYLAGCGGSDHVRKDTPDTDKVIQALAVNADGTLSYDGTGDFEGFSIDLSDSRLAGKTVYIEKTDVSGTVDSYQTLSSKYSVRLTETETGETTDSYNAAITIPYTLRGSATDATTVLLTLVKPLEDKNSVLLSSSKPTNGILSTPNANIPAAFFAGYRINTVTPVQKPFIKFIGKSILEAQNDAEFAGTDGSLTYRDRVRAISNVQPGEKVTLTIDTGAFGEDVIATSWVVTTGNTTVATAQSAVFTFIPTAFTDHKVTLSATGKNGAVKSDTLTIYPRAYSYDKDTGEAYCMKFCHSSIDAPEYKDVYGRPIMRDIIAMWQNSRHANTQQTPSSCVECHSTGAFRVDRTATGHDQFPTVYGYDDLASGDRTHLMGVTCEACHGPAMTFSAGLNGNVSFNGHPTGTSIDSGICLTCHEHGRGGSSHFSKFYIEENGVKTSTHENANTVANFNSITQNDCFRCHTGEGAIGMMLGVAVNPLDFNKFSGITCNVCHDPHGEGGYDAQLRKTGDITLKVKDVEHTINAGKAFVCYQCHNTINAKTGVPHNSQAEMFEGLGGYTYGDTGSYASYHKGAKTCVDCHMSLPNTSKADAKTHVMTMSEDIEKRFAACNTECHQVASLNLQVVDGGYELNGKKAELNSLITQLQTKINTLTGMPVNNEITVIDTINGNEQLTEALIYAAYNYNFVRMDRSKGAHNFRYAKKLLELSLADLERFN